MSGFASATSWQIQPYRPGLEARLARTRCSAWYGVRGCGRATGCAEANKVYWLRPAGQ